jgi:hypothetical protein
VATPKPDHPWYGRKNHVKTSRRGVGDRIRDALIDREIERAVKLEALMEDINDLDGPLKSARDPSYEYIQGGLRRLPVRYDSSE